MRCSLLLPAFLSITLLAPAASQAPAAQTTPDTLTGEYNQAMQARDWSGAVTAAQKLVELSPTSQNLYLLANAQLNAGATEVSLATYDRALAVAEQEKPAEGQPDIAWKDNLAKIYIGKGNALLKLHRTGEAVEAYNHSAEFAANPGRAYFNICAVLYNSGNTTDTPAACRKCLQSDPSKADAWFILGSVLFVDAKPDANGKFLISAETRQALEKYLALAPDGAHAADVKQMLDAAAK